MFYGEGLARLLLLIAAFAVCNHHFSPTSGPRPVSELLLLLMVLSIGLYDYGSLLTDSWLLPRITTLRVYFLDIWHLLDLITLSTVITWAIWMWAVNSSSNAYAMLAMTCIPIAVGLLRYFSMSDRIGKLTIMIFAMAENLIPFAVVYLVILIGFVLAMTALFAHNVPSKDKVVAFGSPLQSFLSLFSSSLANYDGSFSETFQANPQLEVWGIMIQLMMVIWFSIVLLNVVIAQMSATHQRVDEKAHEEWLFARAKITKAFILLEERHPFAMLPPPFNLVTTIVFPLHYLCIHHQTGVVSNGMEREQGVTLSLAGLAADWTIGLVMTCIAPWIELGVYLHAFVRGRSPRPILWREVVVIMALFVPIIYPVFVLSLCVRLLHQRTYLQVPKRYHSSPLVTAPSAPSAAPLTRRNDVKITPHGARADDLSSLHPTPLSPYGRIVYPFASHFEPALSPEALQKANRVAIKLLRINQLADARKESNPVVYFRIGDMQLRSKPSINGGQNPVWLNEELVFPLPSHLNLSSLTMTVVVVDRDPLTSIESFLQSNESQPVAISCWIANGQYSGPIVLDRRGGEVLLTATLTVTDFLKEVDIPVDEDHRKANALTLVATIKQHLHERRGHTARAAVEDKDAVLHTDTPQSLRGMFLFLKDEKKAIFQPLLA